MIQNTEVEISSTEEDLTFFTNEEGKKLEDRFKKILEDVRYFDILVGYFRTSGFYRLYKEFEQIEKIRILVGLNADNKTVELINSAKNQIKSESETKEEMSAYIINEIYNSEDSYNVDLGVNKFIEYIQSGKLEIKAHPSSNIHAKVYISRFKPDDRDLGRVITGSSNFSENGLNAQYEFNVELEHRADVRYALRHFEKLWSEAVDLSAVYIDTIKHKTHLTDEITPYELYLKFVYEYFKDRLELKSETRLEPLPDGYLDLKYQKDAVAQLAQIVKEYDGAFLSDVVGLGKTYIAAMYMRTLAGQKLVICPPHIKKNWEDVIREFEVGGAKVVSLGKLDKVISEGTKKYEYVFVDEAHRFRNENTEQYQMLHQICAGKKVILITATPLNNSVYDFFPLLELFLSPTNCILPGVPNLKSFFSQIKSSLNKFDKDKPEYIEKVKEYSSLVRNKILNHLMVRRTREEIKTVYSEDIEKQGLFFPEVDNPHQIIYKFDGQTNLIFEKMIQKLKMFQFARYQNNLEDAFNKKKSPKNQDQNLIGFLKAMLVKRLESSKYAFLQTISRFIRSYEFFIEMYNKNTICLSNKLDYTDFEDDEEAFFKKLDKDDNCLVYTREQFEPDFIDKLQNDLDILKWIYNAWSNTPTDFKKDEFIKNLESDKILSSSKIIVFTESTETGINLYDSLFEKYDNSVLMYSSNVCRYNGDSLSSNKAKEIIHQNYDPKIEQQHNDVRILITTDVLAEGINLHRSNVIVNYDLPWNPTRVMQRVGRVNRVGTKFDKIHIYNIFPTNISDKEINLIDNIKGKIQAFHEALGDDAKYLTEDEETSNHKLFATEFYEKITNKDTFNEDNSGEFSTLKYVHLLEELRDNNPAYFNKIKNLPKKARTSRKYNINSPEKLITFFFNNNHKIIYETDGQTSRELSIEEAIPYFECPPDCVKQPFDKMFYDLLSVNKSAFINMLNQEMFEGAKKTSQNGTYHKTVIDRIKFILQECRRNKVAFTDNEEKFLNDVLTLYDSGEILSQISRNIKKELTQTTDCREMYEVIKQYSPDAYFDNKRKTKHAGSTNNRGIILSEMLVRM